MQPYLTPSPFHPYLIPGLEAGPYLLERLLGQFSESSLDEPTHTGRFTPREVIAHLADWEPILRDERMKAPLNHPGMTIKPYDEEVRANELGYRSWNISESVERLKAERAVTIDFVKSLNSEQLATPLVHPERGPMTVYDIANMMMGHDLYHIRQLQEALAT